jgi:quercetin dioxygenase-like cupin family protein
MSCRVIDFEAVPWQPGAHPLERKKTAAEVAVTLLEFAPGFLDPTPCRRGHAAYVLEGEIALVLEDGCEVRAAAGGAFHLDPGTVHRARNPGTVPVRLFVYSFE